MDITANWIKKINGCGQWHLLQLPKPPSVNSYWRQSPKGVYLTRPAKAFRNHVQIAVLEANYPRFTGPVFGTIELSPGSRRTDLDNYEKALWDALEHAGVLLNDSQVCCVLRHWGPTTRNGSLTLRLAELTSGDLLKSVPKWSLEPVESGQAHGKKGGNPSRRSNTDGSQRKKRKSRTRIVRR